MTNTNSPTVSVIVPSFNENPDTIYSSLQSLRNQTWSDFECMVIDESTDPGKAEAVRSECTRDIRFHYVRPESRIGLAASLNLGILKAKANLIARFDADDICMPQRLALQVAFLHKHPEIGVLGGSMEIIDNAERPVGCRNYPLSHKAIETAMMTTNAIAHPTVMFRRSVSEMHGAYDSNFRFSEDLDLWLRWLNAGVRFANLPDILLKYRQQYTHRNASNWDYNLMARRRNFTSKHMMHRMAGILGIAIWSKLPVSLQERFYRIAMFK